MNLDDVNREGAFEKETCEEIDVGNGCVWRCSWNNYGTMLAASYTNDRGKNMVQIIKENEIGKWDQAHTIDA